MIRIFVSLREKVVVLEQLFKHSPNLLERYKNVFPDVFVTKDGPVVLSKDIIKEVDEIEAYMAKGRTSRK